MTSFADPHTESLPSLTHKWGQWCREKGPIVPFDRMLCRAWVRIPSFRPAIRGVEAIGRERGEMNFARPQLRIGRGEEFEGFEEFEPVWNREVQSLCRGERLWQIGC